MLVFGHGPEGQLTSFGGWVSGIVGILVLLKVFHGHCVLSGGTMAGYLLKRLVPVLGQTHWANGYQPAVPQSVCREGQKGS